MNLKVVGAGLADGKIKISDGNEYDIHAIITLEGDPQMDDVAVKGDDELKATFYFNQREEMTISANGISFDVLQAITGNSYSSSPNVDIEIPLGTESEQNPPFVQLAGTTKAKDADGAVCTIEKIWHKVQVGNIKISQGSEKEFNIEMTGTAYITDEDIVGAALSPARVATLKVNY